MVPVLGPFVIHINRAGPHSVPLKGPQNRPSNSHQFRKNRAQKRNHSHNGFTHFVCEIYVFLGPCSGTLGASCGWPCEAPALAQSRPRLELPKQSCQNPTHTEETQGIPHLAQPETKPGTTHTPNTARTQGAPGRSLSLTEYPANLLPGAWWPRDSAGIPKGIHRD